MRTVRFFYFLFISDGLYAHNKPHTAQYSRSYVHYGGFHPLYYWERASTCGYLPADEPAPSLAPV